MHITQISLSLPWHNNPAPYPLGASLASRHGSRIRIIVSWAPHHSTIHHICPILPSSSLGFGGHLHKPLMHNQPCPKEDQFNCTKHSEQTNTIICSMRIQPPSPQYGCGTHPNSSPELWQRRITIPQCNPTISLHRHTIPLPIARTNRQSPQFTTQTSLIKHYTNINLARIWTNPPAPTILCKQMQ